MLGIGIVIWVIGAIMSTAAFFSLERGMCDDASGVDHIAEHERLRIASDDFVEDVECVFHARFGAHESDVVPHRLSQEVCIGEFIVGDESRTLEFGENGDGVALSRREAIFDIDADASPKDESFEQRIARQAICAMNARSRDFATSPQAIDIGSSELVDADAAAVFGWVESSYTDSSCADAGQLMAGARAALDQRIAEAKTITVSAVDLSDIGDAERIEINKLVPVVALPHGIDELMPCTALTRYLWEPQRSQISLGASMRAISAMIGGML